MGIKERQERDREAVRRSILDAARDLFVQVGFEHVSMRKIAELVEYSPAAIYGYFPSKDDIFFALAEEGFRLLHGTGPERSAIAALPPLERIRQMFWRLYQFSCEHPQYFALMFVDRSVPRISREYDRFAFVHEMKAALLADVKSAIEEGSFPDSVDADAVARVLSSAVIGVAVLRLGDRLGPSDDADAIANDVLDVSLAGLRSTATLRSASRGFHCEASPTSIHDASDSFQEPRS
jgi:AcrR family transcriptional regulator